MKVVLPWPHRDLSPNARVHWTKVSQLKAKARAESAQLCLAAGIDKIKPHAGAEITVKLNFVPPNRRARDLDNCLSSLKAALDGLADALGADDSRFQIHLQLDRERVGGFVEVEIVIH